MIGVESRQRKAHSHAVIVIGVNAGRPPLTCWQGMNAQPIGAFFDVCTQFARFFGHGRNAIGFFHTPAGNVAQSAGAICIQSHHSQGHGGIWNVIAI